MVPVQDDVRERQMLQLFNLVVPRERKRADIDAFLKIDEKQIPFELKSTTATSVSTGRDIGARHLLKWRGEHWLFGFYDKSGSDLLYCCYASPAVMAPWIDRLEAYIRPDVVLSNAAQRGVTEADVVAILGDKPVYTAGDAKLIQKNQWTAAQYRTEHDTPEGYSRARMAQILRERCGYLIGRGATLNNPHIPGSLFADCEKITEDHAMRLRQLVRAYLEESA